jgi:hypothetical protein
MRHSSHVHDTARNFRRTLRSAPDQARLAALALRGWSARQVLVAAAATAGVALLVGVPTVLVPNPFFTREIPVEPWSYPVWIVTSVLAGLLVATYVRPRGAAPAAGAAAPAGSASKVGTVGGVLTWFAVGCPVCNNLVLHALGYYRSKSWFPPCKPHNTAAGGALTAAALLGRLRGQVTCPVPEAARG